MGTDTKIEWATHTGNLWFGCVEVHEGCDHCYARTFDKRVGGAHWGAHSPRRAIASVWSDFAKWQKAAAAGGRVDRVFVGSMMDIFERSQPAVNAKGDSINAETGELRDHFFKDIVPNSPNLLFLLLTKRPQNITRMVPVEWLEKPPANVMYGYSAVNQATADQGIPHLLKVPGRHFLSCEPLLGPVDLFHVGDEDWDVLHGWKAKANNERGWANTSLVDWVIVGGESGHHARPMHPDWARSLRDQCVAAGVPFYYKQWGEWAPGSHEAHGTHWTYVDPGKFAMKKVGKHAAGRLLDGREWSEFPA